MNDYKCNLIVPGFAKCGTSSLHQYLDMHPKICMSSPRKEPHFFTFPDRMEKGAASHNTLFAHADKQSMIFGESSTSYCVWEPAIDAIKYSLSDVKIVVLLRHPVDRLLSHFRWMCTLGLESNSLETAIEIERQSTASLTDMRRGCFPWYLRHSSYQKFGGLLVNTFGRDRVFFLKSDKLKKNRLSTLNSTFEFLGLEPLGKIDEVIVNVTSEKGAQMRGLNRIRSLARPLVSTRLLDAIDPKRKILQAVLNTVGTKKPQPQPAEKLISVLYECLQEDIDFYEQN